MECFSIDFSEVHVDHHLKPPNPNTHLVQTSNCSSSGSNDRVLPDAGSSLPLVTRYFPNVVGRGPNGCLVLVSQHHKYDRSSAACLTKRSEPEGGGKSRYRGIGGTKEAW
jgi:hypothetical protein